MLGFSLSALNPVDYFKVHLTPGRTKLLIALLLGLSASVFAGLLLRSRRRRYRAVSTSLQRSETFCETSSGKEDTSGLSRESSFSHTPNYANDFSTQTSNVPMIKLQEEGSQRVSEDSLTGILMEPSFASAVCVVPDKVAGPLDGGREEEADGGAVEQKEETEEEEEEEEGQVTGGARRSSVSSTDSFYSAEGEEDITVDLYMTARKLVQENKVKCRKNRAALLRCEDEQDFLAKLHCVRQAFDKLVGTPAYRTYFMNITRDIMTNFLQGANQDPAPFIAGFQDLTDFLEGENGWETTKKELTSRKVVCVNIYDVALDFILLDAFDDLQNPPGTLVNVLQNRWLTENLKISGISTVIWAVSKTKKGLLKTKNGFMSRFYSLSETISPILAWGFMGTNAPLKEKCSSLKANITEFVQCIFSREKVNYASVDSLAEDVLRLARELVQSMQA